MLNVSFVWWSSCLNIYPHVSYYRRHVNYIRAARTYSIESVCRIWKTICSPFMEPLPRDSLTPQDKSVMQTSSIWRDMVKLKCNRPCSGCFVFMRLYMRTCMQCRFEFTSKVTRRQIGLLRGFLFPLEFKVDWNCPQHLLWSSSTFVWALYFYSFSRSCFGVMLNLATRDVLSFASHRHEPVWKGRGASCRVEVWGEWLAHLYPVN